jgi:hypothetical protein
MRDPGHERLRAYRLALGEFVDLFSKVESFVRLCLRQYTKTPRSVANAVFSGVRVDTAINLLRRLRETEQIDNDKWKDLSDVISQIKIITDRRNDILHHGAQGVEDGIGRVTNALFAHIEERIVEFPISAEILEDMTSDLRKIMIHLYNQHLGRLKWPLSSDHERAREILREPWRYKPLPQPNAKSGDRRSHRRSQRNQRDASLP